MSDYLSIIHYEDEYGVAFMIESDEIFALGERMNAICEDAYMNGYNWDAVINCWLEVNAPELLDGLDSDPEAGSYSAYYSGTDDNEGRAKRLAGIITEMVADEQALMDFLQTHADDIQWD